MRPAFPIFSRCPWAFCNFFTTSATETDEDPDEKDVTERWARFGQDDHIRMYAKDDFLARLAKGGFQITALGSDAFSAGTFTKHGITDKSVLYIGRK